MKAPVWLDYGLYMSIGGLTFAQTVTDWLSPQAYIGIALSALIALKAKRSGNGSTEDKPK